MRLRRLLLLPVVAAALLVAAAPASASGRVADSTPWCGSGEPTTDQPDAISAFSWHVVYAVPANGVDDFASYAPRIAADVQAIQNWWVGQDPGRIPRFDLLDVACGSDAGRVDISFLRLSSTLGTTTFDSVVADATKAGFVDPDKIYLFYVDDTPHGGTEDGLCGTGAVGSATDGPAGYAVTYLRACGQDYSDDLRRVVVTHEMLHSVGAVPPEAPHYCDNGHVCDSSSDIMKAVLGNGDWLGSLSLDVGRDDYYGHSGSWWDVRNSPFLQRLDVSLPAPPPIAGLTATSTGTNVVVDWSETDAPAGIWYRVYRPDGTVLDSPDSPQLDVTGAVGDTLQWTVRAANDGGLLGPPATLRFKVGYGIVDASGTLLHDTVPPAPVTGLAVKKRTRTTVVLRWHAVPDVLGLRGYRVRIHGRAPVLVTGTSVALRLARARGRTVTVETVDEAGNLAHAVAIRVRR